MDETRDFAALYGENDRKVMKTAEDSLDPRVDRVDEIIAYARAAGYDSLGIAHCISFQKEAAALERVLEKEGFRVEKVHCKYGRVPFREIVEGYRGISCNPAGQAEYLREKGTRLNIMMGLCLGHDMIFNEKSDAPVTPLVVKDRKRDHRSLARLRESREDGK
ncbi:MAG: DUF1847 domain-containing protein [Bacteroidales bacterium]